MDWLFAGLIVVILLFPVVFVASGSRRNWPFRRYGPYILSYVFLTSLGLLAGVGMRGWILVLSSLAAVGGAGISFLLYARVGEMGEEAQARRRNRGS